MRFKKFIATIGITALISSFALPVFAQTSSVNAADVLPGDLHIVYELNTGAKNPFGGMIDQIINNLSEQNTSRATTEETTALQDLTKKILTNNTITVGIKLASDTVDNNYFITFQIEQTDLDALLANDKENTQTETYSNITTYQNGSSFMALLGNLLVLTKSSDDLHAAIDNYTKKTAATLSNNPNYQWGTTYHLADGFLNMYINPSYLANENFMNENMGSMGNITSLLESLNINSDVIKALLAEVISVNQIDGGFSFNVAVKSDQAKLSQLGFNFTKDSFVPSLYKMLSGQDMMLYSETANLKMSFEQIIKLLNNNPEFQSNFTTWKANLKKDAQIDFDQEVLPLLTGKYLIAVHKTDQIYPAVTTIADLGNNSGKMTAVLTKLTDFLKKDGEKNMGNFFKTSTAKFGGGFFYQFTYDIAKISGDSPLKTMPLAKTQLTIQMAVTTDGKLVISTHPHFYDIYMKDTLGMTNNTSIKDLLKNPTETTSGLFYLSFDTLRAYLESFNDHPNDGPNIINAILGPWHDFYAKSYANGDTNWGNGVVHVDAEQVGSMFESLMNMMSGNSNNYPAMATPNPQILNPQNSLGFCDVHEGDWFFNAVDELNNKGIVKGYPDNCFHPARTITRAEFITMVMKGLDYKYAPYTSPTIAENHFTDVDNNNWYGKTVNDAYASGFIVLPANHLFRPNDPITRAEAVQILNNTEPELRRQLEDAAPDGGPMMSFTDVKPADWYFNAVETGWYYGFVNGTTKTTFEPGRNLNRAEAAKLFATFMPFIPATPPY